MHLGISSYTFVWAAGVPGYPPPPQPLTVERLLQKAVELGVRVTQLADNMPLDGLTDQELDHLCALARRQEIILELGTSGVSPPHLRNFLRLAVRLKANLLRVVVDTEHHRPAPDEVVETLKTIRSDFERAGVWLAIENHDRFKAATLAGMLDRLDSSHIGLCLDTANSIGCLESVETVVATVGRRVVNLHVKDFCIARLPHQKGFLVEGRPAGQGQLDIPWLLAELRRQGRDPNVILELWPPPEASVAASMAKEDVWAAESIRYLRRFIPE